VAHHVGNLQLIALLISDAKLWRRSSEQRASEVVHMDQIRDVVADKTIALARKCTERS
jgi:hypothetical protein